MNNEEFIKEQSYLDGIMDILDKQHAYLTDNLAEHEKNMLEANKYYTNNYYDMDAEERATCEMSLNQLESGISSMLKVKALRERQQKSPYFGRIDFMADDEEAPLAYYIGIGHLSTPRARVPLVVDWRAPLASMYYDYELGRASYALPSGQHIAGRIFLKRQYKTVGRHLEYAFDSNLTISDDILRSVLSEASSRRMKNIVATIQTQQNKIIRAPLGENLIVQGVAGSGKTSVALHRAAWLMYSNHFSSDEILIISPNGLFSDYISNVLPELGEADAPKMTFDEIASEELAHVARFEPKTQMLEDIISGNTLRATEVQKKSSFAFLEALQKFLSSRVAPAFRARDIKLGKTIIKAEEIQNLYSGHYLAKTPATRVEWIADFVVDRLEIEPKNQQDVFERVKRILQTMFENIDVLSLYEEFLKTQKMELVFLKGKTKKIRYEDMAGVLFVKNFLLGTKPQKQYKHIIIDEMQDYSATALAVLVALFPATKTFLGDEGQSLEKVVEKNFLKKLALLSGGARVVNMFTSYRCTEQIVDYAKKLYNAGSIKKFNREGEKVNFAKGLENIEEIANSLAERFDSVAIITSSIAEATKVQKLMKKNKIFFSVDESCGKVENRYIIAPVALTKGLEFDAVIFVDQESHQKIYKNLKYVACTRALHSLTVLEA